MPTFLSCFLSLNVTFFIVTVFVCNLLLIVWAGLTQAGSFQCKIWNLILSRFYYSSIHVLQYVKIIQLKDCLICNYKQIDQNSTDEFRVWMALFWVFCVHYSAHFVTVAFSEIEKVRTILRNAVQGLLNSILGFQYMFWHIPSVLMWNGNLLS